MEAMKEQVKKMVQETLANMDGKAANNMPCIWKPFTMCNGGSAVETMKAFECATYDAYTETKKKIVQWRP